MHVLLLHALMLVRMVPAPPAGLLFRNAAELPAVAASQCQDGWAQIPVFDMSAGHLEAMSYAV